MTCNQVWGITINAKDKQSFEFLKPKVAEMFGIFRVKDGFSERANIMVDENGKIVFFKVYDIPELPNIEEIIDFLKNR